ncbi:MAG: helix-turn-helix domain-containing protein, partial [Actinobacteria bacterium]|nr:helix-turn-helix domain-containing protein [Actinomycetota bacterium]
MSLFTSRAVPALLREMNERKVLDTLRAQGALHAAEIARINGLSKPTTSVILRSLVD